MSSLFLILLRHSFSRNLTSLPLVTPCCIEVQNASCRDAKVLRALAILTEDAVCMHMVHILQLIPIFPHFLCMLISLLYRSFLQLIKL